MPGPFTTFAILLFLAAWLVIAFSCRRLTINPRGDIETGIAWHVIRIYVRVFHRLHAEGVEHIPAWQPGERVPGPLVVVANHASGVDPLLIQACCVFEIRWLMLSEMMVPAFGPLWSWIGAIPVGGSVPGSQSARAAIKHLQEGGILGIFPEGGIERPAGTIIPFEPGVGLIIAKSEARVLQVVIDGAPDAPTAFGALIRRGRARLRFLPMKTFAGRNLGAKEIVAELQSTLEMHTGWPVRTP